MRRACISAAIAVALLGDAWADPNSETVRRFGLLGEWRPECAKPAGGNNPQLLFVTPEQGLPTKTLQMNSPFDGTIEMREARIIAPDRLAYTETDKFGTYAIVLLMRDGHLRSFQSTKMNTGEVLIRDGKFLGTGAPTPLFQQCSAN
jgi:hypothetical protein